MYLLFEEFKNFSQVILKYTIITMSHNKSQSRSKSLILGPKSELETHKKQRLHILMTICC